MDDVMEWLASDVVTLTHRTMARYRQTDEGPEATLAAYCGTVRELLDAAMLGPADLERIEQELSLS